MKVLGWRVWVADGTMLDSRNHKWEDIEDDIQVAVTYFADTYEIQGQVRNYTHRVAQGDYYWMDDDGVIQNGNVREVPKNTKADNIKLGRWIDDANFWAIYNKSLDLKMEVW